MYEQQRDQLANQQFNIDQTAFALNTIKDTQQTVAAMSAAAKTLKKEQKKININDIENMQDEMEGIEFALSLSSLGFMLFFVVLIRFARGCRRSFGNSRPILWHARWNRRKRFGCGISLFGR